MSNFHSPTGHSPTGSASPGPAPVDTARQAERKAEQESLGSLMSQVSNDLSTLIRQETALAKAELSETAKRSGKGAGMFGGAGIAGHFVLLFLSIALWAGIGSTDLGSAWSAVIVAAVWALIAAVLAVLGKKNLEQVKGAPHTTETLKEVPDALTPTKETR
ncbi:phage holin family protein [Nesterenkonia sp. E16_7]|uniref:phage holin family protein n=1 Tax=unclassified Nesterenkonia TaxID=2629769 RepID=UPI001A923EBD|nr:MULTISPECIES: phage holin family protein [unclassified Nesterenkonia]MBO0595815.1 phage holin family protein [Nesterenkonia sp. E16_10]MBO0599586.1 phage holin family protein [Nesterenkonia sp. E16_7]